MRKLLAGVAVLFVLAAAFCAYLGFTPGGLRVLLALAVDRVPGELRIDTVDGRLVGPMRLHGIAYVDPQGNQVEIPTLEVDWRPSALLQRRVQISRLLVSEIALVLPPRSPGDSAAAPPPMLPTVSMPIDVALEGGEIGALRLREPGQTTAREIVRRVRLAGYTGPHGVVVERLEVDANEFSVAARGNLSPEGRWPLELDSEWTVSLASLPRATGRLRLGGDLTTLTADATTTAPVRSDLSVKVNDPLGALAWNGQWNVEPFDLGNFTARGSGWRLGGVIAAQGGRDDVQVNAHVPINAPAIGDVTVVAAARVTRTAAEVQQFELSHANGAAVTGHGRLAWGGPLPELDMQGNWRNLRWPLDNSPVWESPSGEFSAQGNADRMETRVAGSIRAAGADPSAPQRLQITASLRDLRAQPKIAAAADVPLFAAAGYELRGVAADVYMDLADATPSHVDLTARSVTTPSYAVEDVRVTARGLAKDHHVQLSARSRDADLQLALTGSYQPTAWRGTIDRLVLARTRLGDWSLAQPATVSAGPTAVVLDRLCLTGRGRVCGQFEWQGEAGWQAVADVQAIPADLIGGLVDPDLRWTGEWSGHAELRDARPGVLGQFAVTAAEGSIAVAAEDETVSFAYHDVTIRAELDPQRLRGEITGRVNHEGELKGTLELAPLTAPPAAQKLSAEAHVRLPTVQPLQVLLPDMRLEQGRLELSLTAAGTTQQPIVSAAARLEDGIAMLPAYGLRLQGISIDLHSVGESRVEFAAGARAGEGDLSVSGDMNWSSKDDWRIRMDATAKGAELVHLPEVTIVASPDLDVTVEPGRYGVLGTITVDRALIQPELARAGAVALSSDVVIVGEAAKTPVQPARLNADVSLALGDDVQFRGYGVQGRLRGGLKIAARPDKPTVATGEIEIVDGYYVLYGRQLDINPGRLFYTGGVIDDPAIDARAVRTEKDVTVGAIVSGTLRAPELRLFSDPAMSDSDKISYLMVGRPMSQAKGADATVLLSAARSLLPKGGGDVTERIKNTFGLETVALEGSQGPDGGTALVLGKYISPQLYVSYVAGLADALNKFRVRYELSKHWLLQTESSARDSGGDILYSIER